VATRFDRRHREKLDPQASFLGHHGQTETLGRPAAPTAPEPAEELKRDRGTGLLPSRALAGQELEEVAEVVRVGDRGIRTAPRVEEMPKEAADHKDRLAHLVKQGDAAHNTVGVLKDYSHGPITGSVALDVHKSAMGRFNHRLRRDMDGTIWAGGVRNTYHMVRSDKITTQLPRRAIRYWAITQRLRPSHFHATPSPAGVGDYRPSGEPITRWHSPRPRRISWRVVLGSGSSPAEGVLGGRRPAGAR